MRQIRKNVAPALTGWMVACASVLTLMPASAQERGFSYKGMRLGVSVGEVPANLPAFECFSSGCNYGLQNCVSGHRTPSGASRREACEAATSFAGQAPLQGTLSVRDGKVGEVYLFFPRAAMTSVADAVELAYGPPATSVQREFQTRAGGKFMAWEKTWRVGAEMLQINEMAARVDQGAVRIVSDEFEQQAATERAANAKKGSRDF